MDRIEHLDVFYHERKVGTLASYKKRLAAFAYEREWLENGFPISPFSLPLENKVFVPRPDPFDGLFGVFADSLPDGWGRLLVDRPMQKHHIDPRALGNLECHKLLRRKPSDELFLLGGSSGQCSGYFGTRRFDRIRSIDGNAESQRIPMISVSGLFGDIPSDS